jgi:hypothetical protein
VLAHTEDIKVQDLCNLLQASCSIKQALQHQGGNCNAYLFVETIEELQSNPIFCLKLHSLKREAQIVGCARWLARYTGLLECFSLLFAPFDRKAPLKEIMPIQARFAKELQAQVASLQVQVLPDGRAWRQTIHLKKLMIDYMPAAELLNALATVQLGELSVVGLCDECIDIPPELPPALATLTSLQKLELQPWEPPHMVSSALDSYVLSNEPVYFEGVAEALHALTKLTVLSIDVNVTALEAKDAQQLPPSLRLLGVTFVSNSDGSDFVDLSHLTALHRLRWGRVWHCSDEGLQVALPQQLDQWVVHSPLPVLKHAVQVLRTLEVELTTNSDLCSLPQLLSAANPRALQLTFSCDAEGGTDFTAAGLQQAVAGLSFCTNLVTLTVSTCDIAAAVNSSADVVQAQGVYQDLSQGICWFQPLLQLQNLKVVAFTGKVPYVREDLLLLSSLTALEALSLIDSGGALDDECCLLLTENLTGLQQLLLKSDGISNLDVIPAAANSLSNLVSLCLEGPGLLQFGDAELLMLTRLTRLERLGVACRCPSTNIMLDPVGGLSEQAMQEFSAASSAVPGMIPGWATDSIQEPIFQVPDVIWYSSLASYMCPETGPMRGLYGQDCLHDVGLPDGY